MSSKDMKGIENTKTAFSFPFEPYSIQVDFMRKLTQVLDDETVGIFESPTGTGKSLSLICGTLTWQRKQLLSYRVPNEGDPCRTFGKINPRKRKRDDGNSEDEESTQEILFFNEEEKEKHLKKRKIEEFHDRQRKRVKKQKKVLLNALQSSESNSNHQNDDSHLILTNYDEQNDTSNRSSDRLHSIVNDLFSDDSDDENERNKTKSNSSVSFRREEDGPYNTPKIIYCSRTHSQITQFVRELRNTSFGPLMRVSVLGSRKTLCIHPQVKKLPSLSQINERCLELQRHNDCPYADSDATARVKDRVMLRVQDVEDVASTAMSSEGCGYYGVRRSVPAAHVVCCPYRSILHRETRESLGIQVKGCVVVFDEAHHLLDAVRDVHSHQITLRTVHGARSLLSKYYTKYQRRLKSRNRSRTKQLLQILDALINFLSNITDSQVMTVNDLSFDMGIDHINLFDVQEFIERAELLKKLHGFVDREHDFDRYTSTSAQVDTSSSVEHIPGSLAQVSEFLGALTNLDDDGKVIITKRDIQQHNSLHFLLLNPSVYLSDILSQAKSVVLAGGTLEPINELKEVLSEGRGSEPEVFRCGHVIPDSSLLTLTIPAGPTGVSLDFTYKSRIQNNTIDELGRILQNVCKVVPGGVICFFPSYRYEEMVLQRWRATGVVETINKSKRIFSEPRETRDVDKILENYKKNIECSGGALLMCVVGGKLSEGINFADRYGRCVVVVGIPYPSPDDIEFKQRKEYRESLNTGTGNKYMHDVAMQAVNQSIGRAIRHAKDYASILLLDQRFSSPYISSRLPGWIREKTKNSFKSFGPAFASLCQFFASKTK